MGRLWLILAALLEVLGPIMGKALIDEHLLPHHLDWPRMAGLLAGVLLTGWIASGLRYLQLVRLSGLAMRSVMRLREMVYGHVLLLPMAFFDRAITGQLVSRVTNDTEAVKTCTSRCCSSCWTAPSCWSVPSARWPGWTGA
jgi:ATP-binding cassette subfamily B multidrug efflux pump